MPQPQYDDDAFTPLDDDETQPVAAGCGFTLTGPPYHPCGPNAEGGTTFWNFEALGGRPRDFRLRDYLTGSLLRDRRPAAYRDATGYKSSALWDVVKHLPPCQQQSAFNLVLLDYFHRLSLARLAASGQAGARLGRLLPALWGCPPAGALVVDPCGLLPSPRLVCRHAWLCPWCSARVADRAYRGLYRALRGRLGGRFLLLAVADVPRCEAGYPEGAPLTAGECRRVRRRVGAALRAHARGLGVEHGLLTYSVGPGLLQIPGQMALRTCCHRVALLGELRLADSRERVRNDWRMSPGRQPRLELAGNAVPFRYWRLPVIEGDERPLRLFVVGSSAGYGTDDLALTATPEDERHHFDYGGIPGAFALQPTFMFLPWQWAEFEAATRAVKSYSLFGEWARLVAKATRAPDGEPSPDDPVAGANAAGANWQRHAATVERRRRLLALAAQHWPAYVAAQARPRGRPPLRRWLAQLLEELGGGEANSASPSHGDLDYLLQHLPARGQGQA